MRVAASKLRADLYNILDETLKAGVPVEVLRRGASLGSFPKPSRTS
jgi:hypothetical protein